MSGKRGLRYIDEDGNEVLTGGLKAARTNKEKYGEDFYKMLGSKGGRNGFTGGYASEKVGLDGLTGPQRAKIAGRKGGHISRRTKKTTGDRQEKEYYWKGGPNEVLIFKEAK